MAVVDFFFRLVFDEFEFVDFSEKGCWAGCFGKAFWAVRGGPEGYLGGSWGVRKASWEGLGRSWGDLGANFKAVRFRIDFVIDFERQKGAKREALGEAKWSKHPFQN